MIGRLPKPPLTEVVFEMRWAVVEGPTIPLPFDPAYPQLLDAFSAFAKAAGFNFRKEMQPPYFGIPKGVSRRFYKSEGDEFPLLQIGPGIFAANESVKYEWHSFKSMAVAGASAVVSNFPKLDDFALEVNYIELRYIDTFDQKFIGNTDFLGFINEATAAQLQWPAFGLLSQNSSHRGRLRIEQDLKKPDGSVYYVDIASAKMLDEAKAIRMETKVFAKGEKLLPTKGERKFQTKLGDWLEQAHDATSVSFKRFIRPEMFEKFHEG